MSKNKKELIVIKDKTNELIEKHNKLNKHFDLLLDYLELKIITEKSVEEEIDLSQPLSPFFIAKKDVIKYTDKIVKKKKK